MNNSQFVWEAGVAVMKNRKFRNYFSERSKSSPISPVITVKFHNQSKASLSLGTGEHKGITNCCNVLNWQGRADKSGFCLVVSAVLG